jgi:hypothetical protein
MVAEGSLPTNNTLVVGKQGPNFPVTWNPRYAYAVRRITLTILLTLITLQAGFGANPDQYVWCFDDRKMILIVPYASREGYTINQTAIRLPATPAGASNFQVNPADQPSGEQF